MSFENLVLSSNGSTFINKSGLTYTLTKSILWNDISGIDPSTFYFTLELNEVFDGSGYTIDLGNNTTSGLFDIFNSVTNISNAPIVKNLGILNGTVINGCRVRSNSINFAY